MRTVSSRSYASAVGLVLFALPALGVAETLTYGPMLVRGATPDTMIVRWGTQGNTDPSQVSLRKKGDATFAMISGAAARDHEVFLSGLSLGTEYEYAIKSGSASSLNFSFHTCPAAGLPMDLVFYGDNRSGPTAHARIVAQVQKHNPEMIFASGDIAPLGAYTQYLNEFFPVVKNLVAQVPFHAAPGNHDAIVSFDGNYGAIFPSLRPTGQPWQPYYAFVCGNSMFIALNSNDVPSSDQQRYLSDKLHQASVDTAVQHVFVWFHHSAYSPGSHGDNSQVQSKWVPLFADPRNKVTAVFSGHDHIYARMKDKSDVLYIVSGGAGADLYSDKNGSRGTKVFSKSAYNFVTLHIAGPTVSGVAYDDADTEIDRFSITKPSPEIPDGGAGPDGSVISHPADLDANTSLDGGAGGILRDGGEELPPPDFNMGCTLSGFAAGSEGGSAVSLGLFHLMGLWAVRRRRRRANATSRAR